MKTCDLHVHSNYSDGTCSLEEVLSHAKNAGLSAIALTDHNTIKGINKFLELSKKFEIEGVPGVEITCGFNGKEVHMLALFIKPESYNKIENFLSSYIKMEEERNVELAKKLNDAGYNLNYLEMRKEYGENINRVHFAKELFKNGYVSSIQNAFDTILNEGAGFYTVPKRIGVIEVVEFIKSIGAVSVLAHPALSFSKEEVEELLTCIVPHGLNGMETDYTTYTSEQSKYCKQFATKFNLCFSGGSDFHGENKPTTKIGVGKGNLSIPYSYLEGLRKNVP